MIKRFVWQFTAMFFADNNRRLAVLWVGVIASLIFTALIFGFGDPIEIGGGRSDEAQRLYNTYFHGVGKTDAEFFQHGWVVRLISLYFDLIGASIDFLRPVAWMFCLALLIAGLIYIPVAFSDEFARAWRTATRLVRERRGGSASGGAPEQTTASAPSGALTWKQYISWELISDFVQELLASILIRRRR